MTKTEAFIWLTLNENEIVDLDAELEDAIEEKMFEIKQFFLLKPAISKTYQSRFLQLEKLSEIAKLFEVVLKGNEDYKFESINFSDDISMTLNLFEKQKSEIKSLIQKSNSPLEIKSLAINLWDLHQRYYLNFIDLPLDLLKDVIVAQEADVMELFKEVKKMNMLGFSNFSRLKFEELGAFDHFVKEWKRISLIKKKEEEWKITFSKN